MHNFLDFLLAWQGKQTQKKKRKKVLLRYHLGPQNFQIGIICDGDLLKKGFFQFL